MRALLLLPLGFFLLGCPAYRFDSNKGPSQEELKREAALAKAVETCDKGESYKNLKAIVSDDPGNGPAMMILADLAGKLGKEKETSFFFKSLEEPFRSMGLACVEKNLDKKGEHIRRALRADHRFVPALLMKGSLCRQMGLFDKAEKALRKCAGLRENWPPIFLEEALLRREQGRNQEAVRLLRRFLAIRPSNRPARLMRARLLISPLKDYKSAGHELERLNGLFPGDADVMLLEGSLLVARRKYRDAAKVFEAVLNRKPPVPDDSEALRLSTLNLGILYLKKLNNPSGAIYAFRRFLELPTGPGLPGVLDRFRVESWLAGLETKAKEKGK